MRLFQHRPHSLTLALASAALAAAVLLTGCGGDGGGNGGGGGTTPAPNPGTSTPTQPEQPETPEEPEQKEVAAPGETVTTGGAEMKVEKADITAKVETVDDTAYVPFTFSIKNTSEEPIDLLENKQTPQAARSAVAVFAADDPTGNSLAEAFGKGVPSDHLTVTLNGEPVQARAAIQVYDENRAPQSGYVLQGKGWYAEFNVVAQVAADWVEADEPLKVEYNLPATDSTQEPLKASFAVTSTGEAPKADLEFNDITSTGGPSASIYEDFWLVSRTIKITNTSSTGTADLSGFVSGREATAMEKQLEQTSKDLINSNNSYSDLMKANAQAAKEFYTKSDYVCKAITLTSESGQASCVASFDSDTGKKKNYLNPGESVYVSVIFYLPKCEDVTASYAGKEMVKIPKEKLDPDSAENKVLDMRKEQYTTEPMPVPMSVSSKKDTLNGKAGYLIWAKVRVVNSTDGEYTIGNTLALRGMTPNTITAEKAMSGTQASQYTATAVLTSGKTDPNRDVYFAKETGTDPKMKKGEIDTVYVFTFVEADAGTNWSAIKYYQNGTYMNRLENPDLSEDKDLGHGRILTEITDVTMSQDEIQDNIAKYRGVQVALYGHTVSTNYEEGDYTYVAARLYLHNSSDSIDLPVEHTTHPESSQDVPSYVTVATSGNYASKYVTLESGGTYKYGVITEIHNGEGAAYVAPGQEAIIQVVLRVPKDWKEVILKYTLPVDDGTKYARFRVRNNGGTTSDSGSSGSGEAKLEWDVSNTVRSTKIYAQDLYLVEGSCTATNTGTKAVSFDGAITKSEYDSLYKEHLEGVRKLYPDAPEDELRANAAWQVFLDHQTGTIRAGMTNGDVYKTMIVVDDTIVLQPGEKKNLTVYVCPKAGNSTVRYYYYNKSIGNTIIYDGGTAVQTLLSRAGELLRAVK